MPEGLWRSIQSVPGGIPDAEIDQITHQNVLRHYRFDGMEKMGGPGALHGGRAARVRDGRGHDAALAPRQEAALRPGKAVTSKDVIALFQPR